MLSLRLLGAPSILEDNREVYLPSQKAQALLFYLAAEHQRSFARSQLIALFWEESSDREGRNSLSTVLTRLRQALPVFPLRAEGDILAWQALPEVRVDLHEFQSATLSAPKDETNQARIQRLEAATALYRGTFLDGFSIRDSESHEEWLRLERERWQQRWLNALEQLIDALTVAGEWARAIEHGRRALAADPLQERFHRALMRLHYFAGDRAAALSQFRACRDVLERELDVEPDAETVALHQAISEGRLERPAPSQRAAAQAAGAAPVRPPEAAATPRLAARLAAARRRSFVGRAEELAVFAAALRADAPPFAVLHIHGPGGVGKSALLAEFARLCDEAGVPAIALDGRNVPPTPDGFLDALRNKAGAQDLLAELPERHVLLVDTYEAIWALDSWMRDQFLPTIPERAMVVLAGRGQPAAGWRIDPGWQEMTHTIELSNLSEADAHDYLRRRDIPDEQRDAVLRFTRGYPLALSLATEVLLQRPGSSFEGTASSDIIRVLVGRFVAAAPSVAHRAALEACSQTRVMTEPLLAAMLDVPETHELFEWLRDRSFISTGPSGLLLHDLAREALAADLKWRNPPWHAELHHRARAFYMAEFERDSTQGQYSALLDLIFLHDNPLLRAIFTWNDIGGLVEDTPRVEDWPALLEIVRRHEGEESARIAERWFARHPASVTLYRDGGGTAVGFFACLRMQAPDSEMIEIDPCAALAWRYLSKQAPLEDGQFVGLFRYWMDRDAYQAISPAQGMIFVAATRFVLTTPGLAYSFHVFATPELWRPVIESTYIRYLDEGDFEIGGRRYGLFMHDWRSQPPRAWLEELAAHETEG
ncbi:MAG TPA: BTAD domain-containing putative transcriptional regulator [Roseiflexaceae bacterium]|nr:BTAD domain-containing putative transcriptional regulator [Roseiflexaceae bacterium]